MDLKLLSTYEALLPNQPRKLLYTSAIAPTSAQYYPGQAQENAIPFYLRAKPNVDARPQEVFFYPIQDRKTILRDSLGPGQYLLPSSSGYYHQ